jgi:hypothetical protein
MPRNVVSAIVIALWLVPAFAQAQSAEGTVTMRADREAVRAGETFSLSIAVEIHVELPPGIEPDVQLPDLSGFEVLARDVRFSQPTQGVYEISLRATVSGTFVISPAIVRFDGKEIASNQVTLRVDPAEPASVQVVEESQASAQIVERGYVRGVGRGVQYGAHFISPVYLTDVRNTSGEDTRPDGGIGIWGRIGWEFPSGFTIELLGGIAANGVDTRGIVDADNAFTRADFGAGARYMFFNDTAFVPFIQLGGSLRWFFFDWLTNDETGRKVDGQLTGAIHGAVGAQIELSPYFGIELGVAVDYTFAAEIFAEGLVSLMPFLGVTLYIYDESGN